MSFVALPDDDAGLDLSLWPPSRLSEKPSEVSACVLPDDPRFAKPCRKVGKVRHTGVAKAKAKEPLTKVKAIPGSKKRCSRSARANPPKVYTEATQDYLAAVQGFVGQPLVCRKLQKPGPAGLGVELSDVGLIASSQARPSFCGHQGNAFQD